ncbi:MAG: SulP family inorganic anion transporter [Planctomyces sp.]|nr:SulP family inorganic anion transporter [Planctomyces sp.]
MMNSTASSSASTPAPSPEPKRRLLQYWQQDLLASTVVFLVALPLCMGIALASGAPVAAGLVTGIVGGLLVGALAGSPLQVSGPAAGLTVICGEVIRQNGMPGLGIAVLIAGVLQFVAGAFRLGQWFRAVSPAVIHGMLSGIGILILSGQLHVLVDDRPRENATKNIAAIPQSLMKAFGADVWEPKETRVARTKEISSLNSLFDQQKTLQKRVDQQRILQATAPESIDHSLAEQQQQIVDALRQHLPSIEKLQTGSGPGIMTPTAETPAATAMQATELALKDLQAGNLNSALETQTGAVANLAQLLHSVKRPEWAGKIGILAVVIIFAWQFLARGKLKLIPAPLLAIIIATTVAQVFQVPVLYVQVPDNLMSGLQFPSVDSIKTLQLHDVILAGFVIAIVASAETLLCATAVDQMHSGVRTRYNKELMAQGLGNAFCGFLGALPMTGVIVRSAANVQAGGKTRLSAILHGVWLLLFTWALTPLLRMIPTSALAGILVYTGFRLIDFKGLIHLWKMNRIEASIFIITVVMIVVEDLLIGVATGIVLSAMKLLLTFSRLDIETSPPSPNPTAQRRTMALHGAATFLRLPVLAEQLEKIPAGAELHVDLSGLDYIDHACLELLMNWAKQHSASGGQLVMDWESLHARFRSGVRRHA